MTPAEEFAALIEEAKGLLASTAFIGGPSPGVTQEALQALVSEAPRILCAAIATWEKIEQYADAPTVGPTRRKLARRFRESALAATKEPKP